MSVIAFVPDAYMVEELMMKAGKSFVTGQMALLMRPEIAYYDHVVIDGALLTNNHDGTWSCDETDRRLTSASNLFRLWRAGEFG